MSQYHFVHNKRRKFKVRVVHPDPHIPAHRDLSYGQIVTVIGESDGRYQVIDEQGRLGNFACGVFEMLEPRQSKPKVRVPPSPGVQCIVYSRNTPLYYNEDENILELHPDLMTVFRGLKRAKIAVWHTVTGTAGEQDDKKEMAETFTIRPVDSPVSMNGAMCTHIPVF